MINIIIVILIKQFIYNGSTNKNNLKMKNGDYRGCNGTVIGSHHQNGESIGSASSTLVELLLCLPALRQADQLIRQYWTQVHRDNQQVNQLQQPKVADGAGGVGLNRHSAIADQSMCIGNVEGRTASVVKMNKLFVEMLEACLR